MPAFRAPVLSALLLMGLAGCDMFRPAPSAAEVQRLERALATLPCFRPMDQWWRSYYFRYRSAWDYLGPHEIGFTFLPAEARIAGRDDRPEDLLYDGPGKVASGSLDTETRLIDIRHCGPNFGETTPAGPFREP